jgi:hypothetical protein
MARRLRLFLLFLLLVFLPAALSGDASLNVSLSLVVKGPSKTYAVVVGINGLEDRTYIKSDLVSAEQDAAKVFAAITASSTGLATKSSSVLLLGPKATRIAILEEIRTRRDNLKPGEELIIYFSGRSSVSPKGDEVFLWPYDSRSGPTPSVLGLNRDILNGAPKNSGLIFIGDGCHIGAGFTEGINNENPAIGVLSSSKSDELAFEKPDGGSFTTGLLSALNSPETDVDGDGLISLEEAFVGLYPTVVSSSFSRQHPTLAGTSVHRLMLSRAPLLMNSVEFDTSLPAEISTSTELAINGKQVRVDQSKSTPRKLVLLGDPNGVVGKGLNYVETKKHQYLYWRETEKLQNFQNPYKSSYAVLVAIDDYDRIRDPLHRGKTGYEPRGFMVERAEELHRTLTHLGFPEQHVLTLYNERGTSEQIEKTLQTFWKGGEHEEADRVLFYFGGHGDTFNGSGVLITYDFDAKRPTSSGFLMRDLVTRHSENMISHQVLFALDACASGLAVYKTLGKPNLVSDNKFRQLSIVRNDTDQKARNFLVAGTVDQPAVWDNGGVFTQALISGLEGKADANSDRLIQLSELFTYVSNEVAARASEKGVRQEVQEYNLDVLGTGKMIFLAEDTNLINSSTQDK